MAMAGRGALAVLPNLGKLRIMEIERQGDGAV
jgi:hypothetical protein